MARGELNGQVAIVTGAGRGIGAAVARRLGRDGAAVVVADLDLAAARQVADELQAQGVNASPFEVNVTIMDKVEAMVRKAEGLGPVSILVHAAGILGREALFRDLTEADWRNVLEVDLMGTVFCNKAVLEGMVSRGYGRIVNVSSIAGKEGVINISHYSAAKGAVIALTKALGKEVAKTGVTVNCIAPAIIKTDMNDAMAPEQIAMVLSKVPMGRMGTAEEVAGLARYLAGPEASFVTAQCYDISGGRATY